MLPIDPAAALAATVASTGDSLSILPDAPVDAVQHTLRDGREARERRIITTSHLDVVGVGWFGDSDHIVTGGSDGRVLRWGGVAGELEHGLVGAVEPEALAVVPRHLVEHRHRRRGRIRQWTAAGIDPITIHTASTVLSLATSEVSVIVAGCANGTVTRSVAGTPARLRASELRRGCGRRRRRERADRGRYGSALWWPIEHDNPTEILACGDVIMGAVIAPNGTAAIASADGIVRLVAHGTSEPCRRFRPPWQ